MFGRLLDYYKHWVRRALLRPGRTAALLAGLFLASLALYPLLGLAFFPRTDAGQFTINLKVPTGTRLEVTNQYVAKVEKLIRQVVDPEDFKLVVSNLGVVPDFSSLCIQRVVNVYTTPSGEDLGRVTHSIREILNHAAYPANVRIMRRGMVEGMEASFKSFALGFLLSFMLLYLILVAQFRSFVDPLLIMLAIPMGFVGVLIILPLTHSMLNVMSLMGVLMLVGIADSNSILIVDFAHNLEGGGRACHPPMRRLRRAGCGCGPS